MRRNYYEFLQNEMKKTYSRWISQVDAMLTTYASIIRDMTMMTEDRCTRVPSTDECTHI